MRLIKYFAVEVSNKRILAEAVLAGSIDPNLVS